MNTLSSHSTCRTFVTAPSPRASRFGPRALPRPPSACVTRPRSALALVPRASPPAIPLTLPFSNLDRLSPPPLSPRGSPSYLAL
ncbi:hypothetical protein B0H17DRAFT_1190443 [Mycena rosella]|uniref:Uncharacterized protein n=1 Tax=Mycena rosella TaxID=1033263 RepID=A0AAD7H339_MYCRO|nr:hypothetical protein B0H17DRAFT_1190443 [Mycena rosella]